jgi:hypothetical protein
MDATPSDLILTELRRDYTQPAGGDETQFLTTNRFVAARLAWTKRQSWLVLRP